MAEPVKTYVIAYNYTVFREWCYANNHDPDDGSLRYVNSAYALRGQHGMAVVEVPGWMRRNDALQIADMLDTLKKAGAVADAKEEQP